MTTVPAILTNDDTARARRSDPITSHLAADRSHATRRHVADAVLTLIRQEGELCGSEINALYQLRRDRHGWPVVHIDSPRKRAGELAHEGALTILNDTDPRGTERVYALAGEATA